MKSFKDVERIDAHCECTDLYEDLMITESEYQGKKVKLNDPIRTSENKNKKFKVYVKNDQGNVVVVRLVILTWRSNVMIPKDESPSERGTIVRIRAQNIRHGIGVAINGAEVPR